MKSLLHWNFAQKLGGLFDGPNDAMGNNFKKNIYEAFVRETIQNSLDARRKDNNDPVVITFSKGNISRQDLPSLFELRKNIEACAETWKKKYGVRKYRDMIDELDRCGNNIPFLLYSDFNTTGMDYCPDDEESGFYAFVKSGGNSVKDNNMSGGSYGFGKAALLNMSNISSLLVSTYTSDGSIFFSGLSRLSSHTTPDGIKRESQGYFTDNNEEEPVTDIQDIPLLFRRKEAGTSFYVLCPYESKDYETDDNLEHHIIQYVIKNFWLAIFKNELEVNIRLVDGFFDSTISLKRNTLFEYASRFFGNPSSSGKIPADSPVPFIKAVMDVQKDNDHLVFEEETPYLGKVYLYLRLFSDGPDIIQNFRAQHMLIRNNRRGTNYGYYGVFICDGQNGNRLLQAAENAQHREWDVHNAHREDREKVKFALEEYENFISKCISKVFFTSSEDGLDICNLEDYLPIPVDGDSEMLNNFCQGKTSEQPIAIDFSTSWEDYKEDDPSSDTDDDSIRIIKSPLLSKVDDDGNEEQTEHSSIPKKEPKEKDDDIFNQEDSIKTCEDSYQQKKSHLPIPNSGNTTQRTPEDDGEYSSNSRKVMTDYRVFTKKCNDEIFHVIVINSMVKSSNVFLKIITLTYDDGNVPSCVPIIYTDNGIINKNRLCKVKLEKGKNIINIKFADTLRHSLTITAKR